MKKIHNPHDKFFKYIFNNVENIKTLLKFILKDELIKYIDIDNIKIVSPEQINRKYYKNYADIIIKTKIKVQELNCNKTKKIDTDIYFIIEHKSYKDKYIHSNFISFLLNYLNIFYLLYLNHFSFFLLTNTGFKFF